MHSLRKREGRNHSVFRCNKRKSNKVRQAPYLLSITACNFKQLARHQIIRGRKLRPLTWNRPTPLHRSFVFLRFLLPLFLLSRHSCHLPPLTLSIHPSTHSLLLDYYSHPVISLVRPPSCSVFACHLTEALAYTQHIASFVSSAGCKSLNWSVFFSL